ncbi:MAG: hypothetical protein ACP5M4_01710 [Acidobacteriaceae bacterium]
MAGNSKNVSRSAVFAMAHRFSLVPEERKWCKLPDLSSENFSKNKRNFAAYFFLSFVYRLMITVCGSHVNNAYSYENLWNVMLHIAGMNPTRVITFVKD